MSTDGPTPPDCDPEVFSNGEGVCVLSGSSNAIERWVKKVAERASARVDWHYSGGRANVLHLGDAASRKRVLSAIDELKDDLEGSVLSVGGPSLYRGGIEDPAAAGAVVRDVAGQTVLDDPEALAVIRGVNKHSCSLTHDANGDRVSHFKQRAAERGMTHDQVVIVVLNVDDVNGGMLAEALMPGFNWQEVRDKGEIPYARGLAERPGIQGALEHIDENAALKLQHMKQLAVVVVDHGTADVFAA